MILKIKEFFKNLFKKVDKILFPSNIKCLGCGRDLKEKQNIEFCDECFEKLQFIDENKCCRVCGTILKTKNICPHCKEEKRHFDMARSVCVYDKFMADLIAKYKYHNNPYMFKTFAYMLTEKYNLLNINVDVVIPVPITKKRKRERGYNQSLLIAKEFSKQNNLLCLDSVLIKTKDSLHQADLGYSDRQKNILNSFKVENKKQIAGKNVLIIDDVLTTGATTSACAEVLKKANAKNVYVLTVASTNHFNKDEKTAHKNKVIKIANYAKNE